MNVKVVHHIFSVLHRESTLYHTVLPDRNTLSTTQQLTVRATKSAQREVEVEGVTACTAVLDMGVIVLRLDSGRLGVAKPFTAVVCVS